MSFHCCHHNSTGFYGSLPVHIVHKKCAFFIVLCHKLSRGDFFFYKFSERFVVVIYFYYLSNFSRFFLSFHLYYTLFNHHIRTQLHFSIQIRNNFFSAFWEKNLLFAGVLMFVRRGVDAKSYDFYFYSI